MKIEIVQENKIKEAKDFVKVYFKEKLAESRFVVGKDGQEILEIKAIAKNKINRRNFILLIRQIIFYAKMHGIKNLEIKWKDIKSFSGKMTEEDVAEIAAVNLEMANYTFLKYKTIKEGERDLIEKINILVPDNVIKKSFSAAFAKGKIIGEETNACRELANMPGGDMTPQMLAQEIKKATKSLPVAIKILEKEAMKKLGMGGILGVARGSSEKPKFIIMEYQMQRKEKPIVLIGKGITFDTGGLNIKPGEGMAEMNMDMSGGAAVAHSIIAAAKLGIKKKIIGLIPAVENMPSGESYRPGDILKSMSGQTIEIISTDAEGRVVLADALTYAEKYQPRLVVDVATLTGAIMIALGERASGLFTKDKKLGEFISKIGEESGDYVWPMPLWDEFEDEIKGTSGDWGNIKTKENSRAGGAITGAMFLYQFAKKFPQWAHIDMGSRLTAVYNEFLSKGAAGAPVRLLIRLIEKY